MTPAADTVTEPAPEPAALAADDDPSAPLAEEEMLEEEVLVEEISIDGMCGVY
ncbi:MAG: mycofactocin precursor [Acidimicrobiia bacterium]|nr:mycofactocin precursor [Acidimicrobiia bacterium]